MWIGAVLILVPHFSIQFNRYVFAALFSAGADWIVFITTIWLGSPVILAQGVARITGGISSFVVNKNLSFEAQDGVVTREVRRFLLLYTVSYGLSLGLVGTGVHFFPVQTYLVKLTSDAMIFVFNFVVMRQYVFAGRNGPIAASLDYLGVKRESRISAASKSSSKAGEDK